MNIAEISQRLAGEAQRIAEYLLPQGKRAGKEWKAGNTSGEPGSSLSVCLTGAKAGTWKDFASGEGGDLVDLWMACRGQTMPEAMTDIKAFMGIRDDFPKPPEKAYRRPEKPACQKPKQRVHEWLTGRGLTADTLAAFKIGEQLQHGKAYAVFPFFDEAGVLLNVKYRNPDDKPDMRQEREAAPCLFGWHLIDPKARAVTITEGEIDAMTLHQMRIPALSVNQGAGNHQWLEHDWEKLERFSDITICFDHDAAGDKGAFEIIQRLGIERCRRVRLGAKDANQWLQDGAEAVDFQQAIDEARSLDPEELRSATHFIPEAEALLYPDGRAPRSPCLHIDKDLPWFEFRGGEVSVWTGINGHGKSLLHSQVQLGLMAQGEQFVVFSGEMRPARLLVRSIRQATGLRQPSREYLRAVGEWMRDRYWIFDLQGTAKLDRLLEVFTYAAKRYGCTQFVIDSLMMTDVPEDGPGSMTLQKNAMRKLVGFAKQFNVHVHLVAHPRKARDESAAPNKMDVAGSGKITDGADNVFSVWSAQKDRSEAGVEGDTEPDGKVELQKQRNGDVQKYTQWLWFDPDSMQYRTQWRRYPLRFVEFSTQDQEVPHESDPH